MLLIDAVFINDGGGKVLLDYLINKLEETELEIHYLLDERVNGKTPKIKQSNKLIYIEPSLINRAKYYKNTSHNYLIVFCFANFPPYFKTQSRVITYFHNFNLINNPRGQKLLRFFKQYLKQLVFFVVKNNSNLWLVQSSFIKNSLHKRYNIENNKIVVVPFFSEMPTSKQLVKRNTQSYLYVSNGTKHKNHIFLIEAFCKFYDKHKKGNLILTISDDYPELIETINLAVVKGYPIQNIGFVDKNTLAEFYKQAEFLIFPSYSESFGLGIVEALSYGCKIIGADLPYTYEVCQPSLVFNPYDIDSLISVLDQSLNENIKSSYSKIENEIDNLLKYLHGTN